MESHDLRRFFAEMLKGHDYLPGEAFQIMGQLIRLTLKYRDMWLEKHGEILTVEETRKAIDIYLKVLTDNSFPPNIEPKINGLIKLWLRNINNISYD